MSDVKLEFSDGVIYAMAGGTVAHAALGAAAVRILGQALLGTCTAYSSDLRVRIDASDLSTFPDATVICGSPAPATIDANAVTNPTLVVEVTSRSTEDYDAVTSSATTSNSPRCARCSSSRTVPRG